MCQGPTGSGARFIEFPDGVPTPAVGLREERMEVLHPRCAGLDVHKSPPSRKRGDRGGVHADRVRRRGVARGAHLRDDDGATDRVSRVAGGERLHACGMEATGVYWKPVWQVLAAGGFELVLANAAHVKNVPGRQD